MDWIGLAQLDALPSVVVPAVVAAAVALTFEVFFKPAIAVRTERRVARDRGRREAAEALWVVASRAAVIARMGPTPAASGRRILTSELDRLDQEIEAARTQLVRSWWSTPREIPELATSGLARPRAVTAGLVRHLASSEDAHQKETLNDAISVVEGDLDRAATELSLAADFLAAPPHRLVRRVRLLLRARELAATNRQEAQGRASSGGHGREGREAE